MDGADHTFFAASEKHSSGVVHCLSPAGRYSGATQPQSCHGNDAMKRPQTDVGAFGITTQ